VDALLELSRIGRTQTDTARVDLRRTVERVARRLAASHPAASVRVDGRLPTVEVNEVRAEQLLDNLIGNALIHGGRPDVAVTVSAVHGAGVLELHVADDGCGVREEDGERIFELFHRGHTTADRGSGVGLGLARRIAEAWDGTLHLVDSEVGARFVVRLPERLLVADGDEVEAAHDGADVGPDRLGDEVRPGPA
jgi:signal transduction histidine kinase